MEIAEIFNSELFTLRTLKINHKVYFNGADVARGLGYQNTRHAIITHVPEKYKIYSTVANRDGAKNQGGAPRVYISRPGMSLFAQRSKMLIAEKFTEWVNEEVLESIFNTGRYEMPDFEKFRAIAEGVDTNSANFEEIKKICIDTNEKLKDPDKKKRGRKGGLTCQQKIRNTKKELKQTKLDLALFQLKDKLTQTAIDKIYATK